MALLPWNKAKGKLCRALEPQQGPPQWLATLLTLEPEEGRVGLLPNGIHPPGELSQGGAVEC